MKKYVFLAILSISCFHVSAQSNKKQATRVKPVKLKNQTDSISYSIGVMVANFYKQQGISKINDTLVRIGMMSEFKGNNNLLNVQQCNQVLTGYMEKAKAEKAMSARKEGMAFLAENKTKPGVITTASGLQYIILQEGTGPKPGPTDKVKCEYEGRLINGTVFDGSARSGKPVEFNVNGVISGWTEALQLMNTGSKYRLFISPDLGYGDQAMGPDIKPGSTLIFDITLVEIVK